MAWEQILGQARVVEALRRALESHRIAHAYLFYGPYGTGKRAVALKLAQALECEQNGSAPCGQCVSCTKVQRLIHPDVQVLLPYPSDADPEDLHERLARLAVEPYATVDYMRRPVLDDPTKTPSKQAFYTVARINEALRRTMGFKPLEGRYKVAILVDADRMRVEAANAFLKLLEEPTPQTVFVLTTERPELLLPTIRSRCQALRFDPLPADVIAQALVLHQGVPEQQAQVLARMADGSYSRALDLLANEVLQADRQQALDFFRQAYRFHSEALIEQLEALAELGRERLKGLLRLMLSWVRDLVFYRTLGENAPLINIDQREAIARFCQNLPQADLEGMVRLLEEAIVLIERNVQPLLVLSVLAAGLQEAMRGKAPERLLMALDDPWVLGLA
ncbi:DNA polymerase III subunit delta' [Rhodothermus bifroesti]|jgi:DNA polymerase-3 subunit delta'|uniref:DNA polymerase III subunit delta n=1 Tax=Rhodothermus marinus TaxID=29549 RepID=A0A7V2AYT7_RHOMR|nr:DNA polymerase III subunit delta' [Rhodothermus bifroesti]GBD00732.1 DNA polymerase III subunit gamma/tau [bacterium HR18]